MIVTILSNPSRRDERYIKSQEIVMTNITAADGENLIFELTSNIVSSYVGNHVVPMSELKTLIVDVHSALRSTSAADVKPVVNEKQKPAVSIRKSLQEDQLTCLECGATFKSLKRHLMTHHFETPESYREKWDLPSEYPMVAPLYAEARSRLAKESGLGNRRRKTA